MSFMDLTGLPFGRLTVKRRVANRGHRLVWECQCSCDGKLVERLGVLLASGRTRSCGCLAAETHRTHGMSKDPTYFIWKSMKDRCCNPENERWDRYGGRGLTICERWKLSYEDFMADMGPRPDRGTIERRDNDLGYFPENCSWESYADQNRNKSNNAPFTLNGVTKLAVDWEAITGINANTMHHRRYRGWSDERILTTGARIKRSAAQWFRD